MDRKNSTRLNQNGLQMLAEREGFDLPSFLQISDFQRHSLKYA